MAAARTLAILRNRDSGVPGALLVTGAAIGLVPLVTYAVRSYRGFLALGPSGVPHNIVGWLMQVGVRLFASRDLFSTEQYSSPILTRDYAPHGRTSFLGISHSADGNAAELPPRRGGRPVLPDYVVPQRQASHAATPEMKRRMAEELRRIAALNPDVLVFGGSKVEGAGDPALHLKVGTADKGKEGGEAGEDTSIKIPPFMGKLKGEIAHFHGWDGSSHMTLSLADAEEAIDKKWANRHAMAGKRGWAPSSFVMVYAPRDDEELAVWTRLVGASCRFVSGGRDIKLS